MAKTPIIATEIGRTVEICKNKEVLFVKPDDPIDLREKILLLLDDSDLQKKLTENSYKFVRDYSYQNRCEKILQFANVK